MRSCIIASVVVELVWWATLYAQSSVNNVGAGCALQLDGVSNYIEIPPSSALQLTGNATIEGWVKLYAYPNNGPETYVFINTISPDFWGIFLGIASTTGGARGSVVIANVQYNLDAPSPVPLDQWVHLAVVRDNTQLRLYQNGILVASRSIPSGNLRTGWAASRIGKSQDYRQPNFPGTIDEVRVWNYARTQTEIKRDMCRRLTGTEPGLVGYWRFDECNGTIANDSSPYGNNGTLY